MHFSVPNDDQTGTGVPFWKRIILPGLVALGLSALFFRPSLLWKWHHSPFDAGDNGITYFPYVLRSEYPVAPELRGHFDATLWTGLPDTHLPYGRSYPTWILYKIFPLGFALSLAIILHQALGWLGTFLLLRDAGRSWGAAFVGGVVFAFSSFLASTRASVTMMQTAAWLPLILWALERFRRRGAWIWVVVAGTFLAAHIMSGYSQIIFIGGLAWFGYGAFFTLAGEGAWRQRWRFALGVFLAGLLGALGSLPHLLPMAEVAQWTPYRSPDYGFYCWGGWNLRGLISLGGTWAAGGDWYAYFGMMNEALAAVGLLAAWRCLRAPKTPPESGNDPNIPQLPSPPRREIVFWLVLSLVHGYLMMGENSHLYSALFALPLYNMFHAPNRHLLVVVMGVAWFAALGFDYLKAIAGKDKGRAVKQVVFFFLSLAGFFAYLWALKSWAPTRQFCISLAIAAGICIIVGLTLRSRRRSRWLGIILAFSFLELCASPLRRHWIAPMSVDRAANPDSFPQFVQWLRQTEQDRVPARCLMHVQSFDNPFPKGNTPCAFGSMWGLSILNCYAQSMPRSLAYLLHLNLYGETDFDRVVWEERGLSAVGGRFVVLKGTPKPGLANVGFREFTLQDMNTYGTFVLDQPGHPALFRGWVVLNAASPYLCEGELASDSIPTGEVRILLAELHSRRALGEIVLHGCDFKNGRCRFAQKIQRQVVSAAEALRKIGRDPKTHCEIRVESVGGQAPFSASASNLQAPKKVPDPFPLQLLSLNLWQLNVNPTPSFQSKELDGFVGNLTKAARSPYELKVDLNPAIYENARARSLATLVQEVRGAQDDLDAAHKILHSKEPVRELAFVIAPGGSSHDLDLTVPRRFSAGTTTIARYRADDILVTTSAQGNGFLVLAVTNCKGWTASVDGQPVPIHAVDGPLMGVQVPCGNHDVRFHYCPLARQVGTRLAGISLAGAWSAVLLLPWLRRKAAKRQQPHGRVEKRT